MIPVLRLTANSVVTTNGRNTSRVFAGDRNVQALFQKKLFSTPAPYEAPFARVWLANIPHPQRDNRKYTSRSTQVFDTPTRENRTISPSQGFIICLLDEDKTSLRAVFVSVLSCLIGNNKSFSMRINRPDANDFSNGLALKKGGPVWRNVVNVNWPFFRFLNG